MATFRTQDDGQCQFSHYRLSDSQYCCLPFISFLTNCLMWRNIIIMILTENVKRLPFSSLHLPHFTRAFSSYSSFSQCQLFENQVVKLHVSKKGWHSLKYCVNMVILCINKRLTICLIKTVTYNIKLVYLK